MKNTALKIISVLLLTAFITPAFSSFSFADSKGSENAEEIIECSLVMKVGSDSVLSNGTDVPIYEAEDGTFFGAPYLNEDRKAMIPVQPLLDYIGAAYRFNSSGMGCDITFNGNLISISAWRGYVHIGRETVVLSSAPEVKTFFGKNVLYIGVDDVESLFAGYYVTFDDSGMIFISHYDEFVNRRNDADEELMKATAKRFIFSELDFRSLANAKGQKLVYDYRGKPIANKQAFVDSFYELDEFKKLYSLFAEGTDNFTHPYILTDQQRFDELHSTYLSSIDSRYALFYDEELMWYIETQIRYADSYLQQYVNFNTDGTYAGLKEGHWVYDSEGKANPGAGWNTNEVPGVENHSVAVMPYQGPKYDRNPLTGKGYGQGYDPAGGRLNIISDGESALVGALEPAALAYQITRDEKYLAFAYDWMVALCSWEHWGPGHFLNCTNTARPLATAYDWLYNDFVRVYGQSAVDDLAKRIYENAVYEAIVTLTGNAAEHYRYGDSSRYWAHVGNWNSCGASGMLIASLAVLGNERYGQEYIEECLYVIAASLGWYMDRGLTYITLDGGYRESAGYWGSVRFMHIIYKVLNDTAGTDFGLSDYPGMNTADYFGCMLEGSSYKRWNYHDDWEGTQPSHWYYLSAELYDNPEFASIRYEQLHSGYSTKSPHRYDVLYYGKRVLASASEVNFKLDYSMTSIDATIVRDSWDRNSLFAGLMGGYNNVAHGQYDSGNWIYENKGIRWFVDLGADNYNLYGGGFAMGYYKYSSEGNNTLAVGSLPHGQLRDEKMNADTMGGQLIAYSNNDYGSATIIDQKTVYGNKVEYAYRGMFVSNSRKTFVIQDEVKMTANDNLYWFAHYNDKTIFNIEFSEDSRTAYMYAHNSKGELVKLRVALVSDNRNLKFEIMDTYTYLLSGTPPIGYSETNKPGIKEDNRDKFKKLVVKAENVTELNMAIVIEVVDANDDPAPGYGLGWGGQSDKLQPMTTWNPAKDTRPVVDEEEKVDPPEDSNLRPKPNVYEIISSAKILKTFMSDLSLDKDRETFFLQLTKIEYCLSKIGRDFNDEELVKALITYEEARIIYDRYYASVSKNTSNATSIVNSLISIKKQSF